MKYIIISLLALSGCTSKKMLVEACKTGVDFSAAAAFSMDAGDQAEAKDACDLYYNVLKESK